MILLNFSAIKYGHIVFFFSLRCNKILSYYYGVRLNFIQDELLQGTGIIRIKTVLSKTIPSYSYEIHAKR